MDLLNRMKSRKFLLTILGVFLVTVLPEHADNIVQVIGMYVGAEGVADIVERYRTIPTQITDAMLGDEDGEIDTTRVVSGDELDG